MSTLDDALRDQQAALAAELQQLDADFHKVSVAYSIQSLQRFIGILESATRNDDSRIIDAVFLQLSRYWCTQTISNDVRLHILRIVAESGHAATLISQDTLPHIVSRFLAILDSNDRVACSLVLRLLGHIPSTVRDRPAVQYRLIGYLSSRDVAIQAAAIFAASAQCRVSTAFANGITETLWRVAVESSPNSEVFLQVLRVLGSMNADPKAYTVLSNGIQRYRDALDVPRKFAVLKSLTLLSSTFVHAKHHAQLLINAYNNSPTVVTRYHVCLMLRCCVSRFPTHFKLMDIIALVEPYLDVSLRSEDMATDMSVAHTNGVHNFYILRELIDTLRILSRNVMVATQFFTSDEGDCGKRAGTFAAFISAILKFDNPAFTTYIARTVKSLLLAIRGEGYYEIVYTALHLEEKATSILDRVLSSNLDLAKITKNGLSAKCKAAIEFIAALDDLPMNLEPVSLINRVAVQYGDEVSRLLFSTMLRYRGGSAFKLEKCIRQILMSDNLNWDASQISLGITRYVELCSTIDGIDQMLCHPSVADNQMWIRYHLVAKLVGSHKLSIARDQLMKISAFASSYETCFYLKVLTETLTFAINLNALCNASFDRRELLRCIASASRLQLLVKGKVLGDVKRKEDVIFSVVFWIAASFSTILKQLFLTTKADSGMFKKKKLGGNDALNFVAIDFYQMRRSAAKLGEYNVREGKPSKDIINYVRGVSSLAHDVTHHGNCTLPMSEIHVKVFRLSKLPCHVFIL